MTITGRVLEENEAKIDNILHKILKSSEHITNLTSQITYSSTGSFLMERIKRIKILNETVYHLTMLADEIDLEDEDLTEELETKIKASLDKAIIDIKAAKELLASDS